MKKIITLLTLCLVFTSCENENLVIEQACDNGTFVGSVTLTTQQEVNDFGALCHTGINGNLRIGDTDVFSDITDLTPLINLALISGSLTIFGNEELQDLSGLDDLIEIGDNLFIANNPALTSFSGWTISAIGGTLTIKNNQQLESITALRGLTLIEDSLIIEDNSSLISLEGLGSISSLKGLVIENNDLLNSISFFDNLTSLNGLYIEENESITTLEGLEEIDELYYVWISNNNALNNLNGLENLANIIPNNFFPSIMIGLVLEEGGTTPSAPNPSLTDFCALENLFTNIDPTSIEILIANNAYNPTVQDIIDGNCAQ
ncbi:MAG: hypothetical protein KJP09_01855 [Bacteroidia bacterium]|nr:hypothetical protein [Bacteroidia bacterium]